MPLIETKGAASAQGFGEFAASSGPVTYIEDVFSTYLYTGTGTTNPIVNSIDLSTKGGMVWIKNRASGFNNLTDTARGVSAQISSNSTSASGNYSAFQSFNTNGFTVYSGDLYVNASGNNYVSWTFRKQPKFFDVVTYTGTGVAGRTVSHNLGSVPGCIIVKRTDLTNNWKVYHRGINSGVNPELYTVLLNSTGAAGLDNSFNDTPPTSTVFSVSGSTSVNASGGSYVAYLFAHNAGGFGLTGTDNVISCGSYTGNGSTTGPEINLGYEPQWLLIKNTTTSGYDWWMFDVMRGWTNTSSGDNTSRLTPDSSQAEDLDRVAIPTATGFRLVSSTTNYNGSGDTYIYIAIRRGPMKVPTSGTSVFKPITAANDTSAITTNFPVDLFTDWLTDSTYAKPWVDRLRGSTQWLTTTSTAIEASSFTANLASNVSYTPNFFGASNIISYAFQRAPSFFDEVCFTGIGSNTTVSHNLAAVPELIVVKKRNAAGTDWFVYSSTLGNTNYILLNSTNGSTSGTNVWNSTTPTSSVFSVGTNDGVNGSANTYVAYLFATCASVSKVGSYTGNGSTQTINCGFGAGGARFVLIKRTDTNGDWYAYDTARGMTTLTDPYTLVNTTSAQVATLGSVTTVSTGFAVNASILAAINTNAASYIFLAIA